MSGIDPTQDYEPWDYDNPETRLILPVKSARLGASIKLARGVTVHVVALPHGAHSVRRYKINGEVLKSATEAAHRAVELSKQAGKPSRQEDD